MQLTMLPRDLQRANEYRFNRHAVDRYIEMELRAEPAIMERHGKAVGLVEAWLATDHYPSKNERLLPLLQLDTEALVMDILIASAYCQIPETLVCVSAKIASRLGFSDKPTGVKTAAELLALVCEVDLYDIFKVSKYGTTLVKSKLGFSDQLMTYIANCRYLPPMVCEPNEVTSNMDSAHLTVGKSSLICGKGNHHEGNICLDIINLQNQVPFRLSLEMLCTMDEQKPSKLEIEDLTDFDSPEANELRERLEQWELFRNESYELYKLMALQRNRFFLTHKVDKRGRLYPQGYHITYQGTAFKKAIVELYDEEVVEGVPDHLRT